MTKEMAFGFGLEWEVGSEGERESGHTGEREWERLSSGEMSQEVSLQTGA